MGSAKHFRMQSVDAKRLHTKETLCLLEDLQWTISPSDYNDNPVQKKTIVNLPSVSRNYIVLDSLLILNTAICRQIHRHHRDTAATVNPFVEPQQSVSKFTAQEIATLQSRLEKQLGPEYISTRPGAGGGKVHYLAAEKVINLANEVFGFNGWSSGIQNVQIDFVDENPQNGKITLGLSIIVRVTLKDGTYHEDVGYGHIENCKGKAAAFEKAKKEAATDALKRALRTFGNVLGNCLYDKDYLQKVAKVKSGPSRWDADNLHRHPDFAPVKEQSITETEKQQNQGQSTRRATSMHSGMSHGSAEFEDDFGGNVFEDVDFTNPQDDSSIPVVVNAAQQASGPPQQALPGGAQRMYSMPQGQGQAMQAMQPQQPTSNAQQLQKSGASEHHMAGSLQHQPPLPQPARAQVRQPQFSCLPPHVGGDGSHTKSTPSSGSSIVEAPSHLIQQASGHHVTRDQHEEQDSLLLPKQPTLGVPGGFVTGRNADMLNKLPTGQPAVTSVAPFNPHAESPSIRRTSGVNPGRSAAITREALQKAVVSSQQVQAPGNGLNGQTTPVRTNFVNPSADMNRRIGMPPSAGGGGTQNRGMYRPPTAVKRPALTDVSNIQQVEGAYDVKKPRLDAPPQKQNGVYDTGG
nr:dna repair and recombination protein radc [Quercus suber]